ncbi:hypothetical protein GCM10007383_32900 [Arenibacter certesii]|uniref:Uncharacterized protein n=1 Tax=Arenibacter certesii TaxID=228955 RepID=A0A918J3S2_9FLAO|nr:hypothetical protein GCM10007383_32900 [Arenibacter certesii]
MQLNINKNNASISNDRVAIIFDLSTGRYNGVDKVSGKVMIQDAWFRLDPGEVAWKDPEHKYKAEKIGSVHDKLGTGQKLRIWYMPVKGYDPHRFLDVTLYGDKDFVVLGWGVKNIHDYTIRVRHAEVLQQGLLFDGQIPRDSKVLRSGAGNERNVVEDTWEIDAHNGAMLTYQENTNQDARQTIVAGGLVYKEFAKSFLTHKGRIKEDMGLNKKQFEGEDPYITLSIWDPYGKEVGPGEIWESLDSYYLDFITIDPFDSLETYGQNLAKANDANPNAYDFPTLCGWMVSTKNLGEGMHINHSTALVDQMEKAKKSGILNYTLVALRLEPDYYCYGNQGDTQQGWWNDEYWSKYGALTEPYDSFKKFSNAIEKSGGMVFTYFQVSLPSNDFARKHPTWMINDDISLLHVDHPHHRPLVRYDYTNSDFQAYLLDMWKRLKEDGVIGIKFDYPETGWERNGGFDDKSYTTTAAYRKIFELSREGMGKDAFLHERNLGETNTPMLDCTIGIVDLQRVWWDASHFEPEMASKIGLRWFKQGKAFIYYPDGKSFYYNGEALPQVERRSFLTLIGLLSGRLELGTSFGSMTEEMQYDLSRIFPVLPNGQAFKPVDMFIGKDHPEIYTYDVNEDWKQVLLVNNDTENSTVLTPPLSGNQVTTGSFGLDENSEYYAFDFWNQKFLGIYKGSDTFKVELKPKEANVFSIHKVTGHPKIIGTNRHIMGGMMELSNISWSEKDKVLKFDSQLVKGETMKIFIALPSNMDYKKKKIEASNARVKVIENGDSLIVELNPKNTKAQNSTVSITF